MTPSSAAEERFCANPYCLVGRWSVALYSDVNQVWQVISCYDDDPYFVAAPTPLCPCCGDYLVTAFEFDGGFADGAQQEAGPLFEFVRHLR